VSGRRRLVANAALLLILGGQALALALDRELWPFSPYAMFSGLREGPTVSRLWLFGVREDGTEIALRERAAFAPLRPAQLEGALRSLLARPDALRAALRDLLALHGARRRDPPLKGLRLYELRWRADPDALDPARPLARERVAEVEAP
jgi:hypothetical protein